MVEFYHLHYVANMNNFRAADYSLSTSYWNNINCDYSRRTNAPFKQKAMDKASVNLLHRLQSYMDTNILLAIFHQEVAKVLPLKNLVFHHRDCVFDIDLSDINSLHICLNLVIDDDSLGQLVCHFGRCINTGQRLFLDHLAHALYYPLRNALDYQRMKRLALEDKLTGLENRNQFDISCQEAIDVCQEGSGGFSLLVLDLDRFKRINDEFGHPAGDSVLISFAHVLVSCSRDVDRAFRFGGDEFTMLLNDTNKSSVSKVASRIKSAIVRNRLLSRFRISCSIGSAYFRPGDSLKDLFARADRALYRAKGKAKKCTQMSTLVKAI